MRNLALGTLIFLFLACFLAIIVEELFLGGRRKRRLMREARARGHIGTSRNPGNDLKDGGMDDAYNTDDRT